MASSGMSGVTFCLEPEEVSCLWHWPSGSLDRNGARQGRPALLRGPQRKATTVRHDVQGLMGSDCMRWLEGLVRLERTPCRPITSRSRPLPTYLPSKPLKASEGDDYESTGPGSNSCSSRSRVRTHLDIGSNRGLENKNSPR